MSFRAPIALVGVACRLPGGVDTLDGFTRLVLEGRDAVGSPPPWRGFGRHEGGYLRELRDFDPGFFGIGAREAAVLDPQQRLLLEVAWEAIEHAGVSPAELARQRTGVWVGISGSEFKTLVQRRDPSLLDAWVATGTLAGVAAGRLAYVLGLSGPAIAVDTACSSSLVALHAACRALWAGEVDAALVAGVHVLLDPDAWASTSKMGTLSPSGRCRTYSAGADGYTRGEGCVAVLLRREPAPSDRVLAWICGTASNHDGRSNGLTAPSPAAQRAVIRDALRDAGLATADIGYHEGHGSATLLGDAVELGVLAEVHAGRADPLPVGSLKANVGHLEAAAGLAGLLRAVVIARSGRVPSQPHATPPCEALAPPLVVGEGEVRGSHAGVSSFGIGGTNAHVVLRAAREERADDVEGRGVLVLSAPSAEGLDALVSETSERLRDGLPWLHACGTAARGRAAHAHRAALLASGEVLRDVVEDPPRVAWLFPGQGPGLERGAALAQVHPRARAALERVQAAAGPLLPADPDDVRVLQVGVFAVSYALAELLLALGPPPLAVAGHSSGEVAAACVAGVLSVEDAVRLLVARGEVLHRSAPGGMAAVVAPPEALGPLPDGVEIAALNHPGETVLSGPLDALEEATAALQARGLVVRRVGFPRAGHSALVEPHLGELERVARQIALRPPTLEIASTSGQDLLDPAGWVRQLRVPVRFQDALHALAQRGADTFVELGPHPVLSAAVGAVLPDARAIRTLHRDEEEADAVLRAVAELWCAGAEVEPGALLPPHRTVDLPPTPFVRRRLWPEGLSAVRPAARHVVRFEAVGADPDAVAAPEGLDPVAATVWAARALTDGARALVLPDEPLAAAAIAGVARCASLETAPVSLPVRGTWTPLDEVPRAAFRTSGTWIVTGGHGALGSHTARWLEENGAERVLRVGRSAGVDVSRAEDVERLLAEAGDALVGVVHAAGVLHDQPVHGITEEAVREVFAGKVEGALHLERALAERPDVLLVLYGSVARLLGGRGQGAYAAANGVLAAIGARRRGRGGRAVTVDWGPWGGGGLAVATEERRTALGVPPMAPERALAALDAVLTGDEPEVAVVDLAADRAYHPLLDGESRVERVPVPEGHVLDGRIVLAGADQVVAALRLSGARALASVRFVRSVVLQPGHVELRLIERDGQLTLLADGAPALTASRTEPARLVGDLPTAGSDTVDLDALFRRFARDGLQLGPDRRLLAALWRGPGGSVAELAPGGEDGARLDACLFATGDGRAVPVSIEHVTLLAPLSEVRWAHASGGDVTLYDAAGTPVGEVRGLVHADVPGLRPNASLAEIEAWVLHEAAAILGRPLDPERDLPEHGFDSMMGVELRNRIVAQGVSVPLHLVVGAATAREIAVAIRGEPDEPEVEEPESPLGPYLAAGFVGAVAGASLLALVDWLLAQGVGS